MRWLNQKWRLCIVGFLVAAVLYVGLYAALSSSGSYVFSQSGRLRYGFGLAVSDQGLWRPCGVRWQRFCDIYGWNSSRGNILGYFYSPLILLDRAVIHPSRDLFDATEKPSDSGQFGAIMPIAAALFRF